MEKKSILARIIKHYANEISAHLIFVAKEERVTVKVAKDLFTHMAFETKFRYKLENNI